MSELAWILLGITVLGGMPSMYFLGRLDGIIKGTNQTTRMWQRRKKEAT